MKAKIILLLSLIFLFFGFWFILVFSFLTALFMPYLNIVISLFFLILMIFFYTKRMKLYFFIIIFLTILIQWFPIYVDENKISLGYMYSNTKGMDGLWFYIIFFNITTILGILFISIGVDGIRKVKDKNSH